MWGGTQLSGEPESSNKADFEWQHIFALKAWNPVQTTPTPNYWLSSLQSLHDKILGLLHTFWKVECWVTSRLCLSIFALQCMRVEFLVLPCQSLWLHARPPATSGFWSIGCVLLLSCSWGHLLRPLDLIYSPYHEMNGIVSFGLRFSVLAPKKLKTAVFCIEYNTPIKLQLQYHENIPVSMVHLGCSHRRGRSCSPFLSHKFGCQRLWSEVSGLITSCRLISQPPRILGTTVQIKSIH